MIPEDVKTEMKPCPFCGAKFKLSQEPHDNHPIAGMYYIYHDYGPLGSPARECRLDITGHFHSEKEAVDFWNRRAILTDREARSGWRDIASLTPEDGMIVVGYGEYRERDGFSPAFMRWHAVLNGWTVTGMPFYPTHWMPIPAAPSASPSPSREETEGEKEELGWKNGEARSPLGDLYEACQLSPLVWVTRKNGTEIATWVSSESLARGVAQADFDRLKKTSKDPSKGKSYHVVFDKFPDHDAPRFIELEDDNGRSISAGEWKKRDDGLVELVLPAETPPKPVPSALLLEAEKALEEAEETLGLVEHKAFPDPAHHETVKALGRRIGFGALMSTAEAGWREVLQESGVPSGGEFVSGPCRVTVDTCLAKIRSTLSKIRGEA